MRSTVAETPLSNSSKIAETPLSNSSKIAETPLSKSVAPMNQARTPKLVSTDQAPETSFVRSLVL